MSHNSIFDVQLAAENLLEEMGITTLPVDPFKIAERLDIALQPMPSHGSGASGMFFMVGNAFGIAYPTHIRNEGYKRFSVAHELGHYYLPGHPDAVTDINGRHVSQAGFVSGNKFELEADHFAAALMMPRKLFSEAADKLPHGLRAIDTLHTLCITSLEATAIRYSQCCRVPVAVIRSQGSGIDYAFMSETLRNIPNLKRIRKSQPLPTGTVTSAFNENPKRIIRGEQAKGVSDLADWFGEFNQEIVEEVVGLGRYGKTLTVLSGMVSPD